MVKQVHVHSMYSYQVQLDKIEKTENIFQNVKICKRYRLIGKNKLTALSVEHIMKPHV